MPIPIERNFKQVLGVLERFSTELTQEEKYLSTQKLFKNLFYTWLFLHTVLLLPFHREVWSSEALVQRTPFNPNSLYDWIFLGAGHPVMQRYYLVFVLGQLVVLALGVIGVAPRLVNLLACVITINLNNLSPVILDGGNYLAQLILLYMIFMNTSGRPARLSWLPLSMGTAAVSNAAFFLCRIQVVIVYVCAAISKLNSPMWQNGTALYYIFQADMFTHPLVRRLIITNPLLSPVGSYYTLAVEALFPVLVWFRRTRPLILLAGVTIHLGISFGMGLFTFGLVMCVMYTLFLTNHESQGILHFFSLHDRH